MFEKFYSILKYVTNRYKIEKRVKINKIKILYYKRLKGYWLIKSELIVV